MASVTVKVNGRPYPIVCGDGEEDHLKYLADLVDKKIKDISGMASNASEGQLLLMASVLIADDLSQAKETIEKFKLENSSNPSPDIEKIAEKIEAIAERLESA